jgi:hypothetical protein
LNTVTEGLYSEMEALNELDNTMLSFYGETLSMAQEEIDKTTS